MFYIIAGSYVNLMDIFFQVKDFDLPLKHNQLIVARNFSLMREDTKYWIKDWLTEEKVKERMRLLTTEVLHRLMLVLYF